MKTIGLKIEQIEALKKGAVVSDENGFSYKVINHKVYRLKTTKPNKKAYTRVILCNSSVDTLMLTGAETEECINDYYKPNYNGTIIYRKCGAKDAQGKLLAYGDEGFKESARKTLVKVKPVKGALEGTRDPFLFEVDSFEELAMNTITSEPVEEVKVSRIVEEESF